MTNLLGFTYEQFINCLEEIKANMEKEYQELQLARYRAFKGDGVTIDESKIEEKNTQIQWLKNFTEEISAEAPEIIYIAKFHTYGCWAKNATEYLRIMLGLTGKPNQKLGCKYWVDAPEIKVAKYFVEYNDTTKEWEVVSMPYDNIAVYKDNNGNVWYAKNRNIRTFIISDYNKYVAAPIKQAQGNLILDKKDQRKEHAQNVADTYNSDKVQTVICKDCGKAFVITEEEAKFYKDNELPLPKRCQICRKARKAVRASAKGAKNAKVKDKKSKPADTDAKE